MGIHVQHHFLLLLYHYIVIIIQMQNFSEESKQRLSDLNGGMRDMVREIVEILMVAESIFEAEAVYAIDFNRESTQIILGKRKNPYNAFTEKLAATKKRNATAGVQSEGILQPQQMLIISDCLYKS